MLGLKSKCVPFYEDFRYLWSQFKGIFRILHVDVHYVDSLESSRSEQHVGRLSRQLGPVLRKNLSENLRNALRESFGSIMTNSGIPDTIVDFWLGHEIGELAEAYKSVQFDSLKQMYLAREKLISISAPKVDVEELKEKLKTEMGQQSRQLQVMVNSLITENMDLKNRIQAVERKLSEVMDKISEMRKIVD